ncbi:GyrI-like domain-containing protein [bacterium]|nr:GyrI-like domain-containing protein [bacterium]
MTIFVEEIIFQPEMRLIGKTIEVQGEPKVRVQTVRALWESFNVSVHTVTNHIRKAAWQKYGVSFNPQPGNHFSYMAAVEVSEVDDVPEDMTGKMLPALTYARFCHHGDFCNLPTTIYEIYNKWLPDSEYHLVPGWQCGISHFERYDQRFQWSSAESEIDIFLPIRTKA